MQRIPTTYLIAGAGLAAALLWATQQASAKKIGESIGGGAVDLVSGLLSGAAEAIPEPINPTSTENLIYKGVNAVGGWMTRDKNWTLGGQIYDWTN